MKTPMTRLGRRSPGRTLAVPRPDTGDWPPAGASQWRPDGKGPQMADIIEVILADASGSAGRCVRSTTQRATARILTQTGCWPGVVQALRPPRAARRGRGGDRLSGPVRAGQDATAQMPDAIADHDGFREDLREASARRRFCDLVARAASALRASSDHVAREERDTLAAFGRRWPLRRDAMSLAASGPCSSPPAPVMQTAETQLRGRLAGRAGQRATRDRALCHAPGGSCCLSWEGERGWMDNCFRRRLSS